MKARIWFGGAFAIAEANSIWIDAPNPHGGIGDISFLAGDSPSVWTGGCWINTSYASVHFGSVTHIEFRKNLNESNEKWKIVYKIPRPFSYKTVFAAVKRFNYKIAKIKKGGSDEQK